MKHYPRVMCPRNHQRQATIFLYYVKKQKVTNLTVYFYYWALCENYVMFPPFKKSFYFHADGFYLKNISQTLRYSTPMLFAITF